MNVWDLRRVRAAVKKAGKEVNEERIFAGYERMRLLEETSRKKSVRVRRQRERRRIGGDKAARKGAATEKQKPVRAAAADYSDIEILPYEEAEKLV